MNEEFVNYLLKKRIDAAEFRKGEPEMFSEWEKLFLTVHPDSFTAQKLFLINPIRRSYPLQEAEANEDSVPRKKTMTPKIKRS